MKFNGAITIDLTKKGIQRYPLTSCDRLWLPKFLVRNGAVFTNPTDCVVGIQVNDTTGDFVPWALADGYMNQLSGRIDVLFVTVITQGAQTQLALMTGEGVGASHGSTDGLSPVVGAGATTASDQPRAQIYK